MIASLQPKYTSSSVTSSRAQKYFGGSVRPTTARSGVHSLLVLAIPGVGSALRITYHLWQYHKFADSYLVSSAGPTDLVELRDALHQQPRSGIAGLTVVLRDRQEINRKTIGEGQSRGCIEIRCSCALTTTKLTLCQECDIADCFLAG